MSSGYVSSAATKSAIEIINEARAKIASKEGVGTSKEERVKEVVKSMQYPVFDLKSAGVDISPLDMNSRLLEAVNVDGKLVAKSKRLFPEPAIVLPFGGGGFKWTQPEIRCPPDKMLFGYLGAAKYKGFSMKYLQYASNVYRSNGTREGVTTRMLKQLMVPNPKLSSTFFPGVLSRVFFGDGLQKYVYETNITENSPCLEKLNYLADAGFPYLMEISGTNLPAPKVSGTTKLSVNYRDKGAKYPSEEVPILVHAMAVANKIIKICDDNDSVTGMIGDVTKLFNEYPELNTFVLKRKEEVMARSDFKTKVRPYGAMALPFRLIGKMVAHPIESYLVNYVQYGDSCSAYKTSQFHGGASFFLQWLQAIVEQPGFQFKGISFGDDQIWVFKFPDGRFLVLGPDTVAMDMRTARQNGWRFLGYINSKIPDMTSLYKKLLLLLTIFTYNHKVHVGGSFIVSKKDSMVSGIPLTTIRNIISSAEQQDICEQIFDRLKPTTDDQILFCMNSIVETINKNLGFQIKNFENGFKDMNELKELGIMYGSFAEVAERGFAVPFLSNRIEYFKTSLGVRPVYVPVEVDKFAGSLICPGGHDLNNRFRMQRLLGITFAGAWYDAAFYDFICEQYSILAQLEKQVDQFEVSNEYMNEGVRTFLKMVNEDQSPDRWVPSKGLPPRYWMIDFNALTFPEFIAKYSYRCPSNIVNPDFPSLGDVNYGEDVATSIDAGLVPSSVLLDLGFGTPDVVKSLKPSNVDKLIQNIHDDIQETLSQNSYTIAASGKMNAKSNEQIIRKMAVKQAKYKIKQFVSRSTVIPKKLKMKFEADEDYGGLQNGMNAYDPMDDEMKQELDRQAQELAKFKQLEEELLVAMGKEDEEFERSNRHEDESEEDFFNRLVVEAKAGNTRSNFILYSMFGGKNGLDA